MLTLSDLQHLPQLDPFIQRILHEDAGVTIVAGFSPRPNKAIPPSGAFLSSGRSAIFNILLHEILEAQPELRALVITQDEKSYRLPRGPFLGRG